MTACRLCGWRGRRLCGLCSRVLHELAIRFAGLVAFVLILLAITSAARAEPLVHPRTGQPGFWYDRDRVEQCAADAGRVERLRATETDLRLRLGAAWRAADRREDQVRALQLVADEAAGVARELRLELAEARSALPWWAWSSLGAAAGLVLEALTLGIVLLAL